MKNTKTCDWWSRPALARSNGRTSSMLAPVVPMTFASTAPIPRKTAFTPGVGGNVPRIRMPPVMTNSVANRAMNEMYSWSV